MAMAQRKERLTVTVDRVLVQAGSAAVAAGRADSLSQWVNQALAEKAARERRLTAAREAIAAYEAEFGEITIEDMAARVREDRRSAIVVRGRSGTARKNRRRAA